MARTNNLTNFLTDVASAIKTKKGDSTPIQASNFDTEIDNLPSGSYADGYIEEPSTYYGTINGLQNASTTNYYNGAYLPMLLVKKIPYFEITLGTTNDYSCGYLFMNCRNLEEIDVSGIDFSNVSNYYFKGMFYECVSLKEIDLSSWDLPISSSGSSRANSISMMFRNCTSLKRVNLSCFKGIWFFDNALSGCTALEHIDIRNLDLSNLSNMNMIFYSVLPETTCEIIVGDNTQKDYWLAIYPDYTNVKTVAEYESE